MEAKEAIPLHNERLDAILPVGSSSHLNSDIAMPTLMIHGTHLVELYHFIN